MPPFIVPIVIAGATAGIGWFFQENSAKNSLRRKHADAELERQRQLREAELSRAKAIFQETSDAMDVLYYLLERDAIYIAVRKAKGDTSREKEDTANWAKLDAAVLNWMTHKTRFATQLQQYFGEDSQELLSKIYKSFADAWNIVEATYYDGYESIYKEGKEPDYSRYYTTISSEEENRSLEGEITALSKKMIIDIQTQNVGVLRTK